MRLIRLAVLISFAALVANGQLKLSADMVIGDLRPSLVSAVLDSVESEVSPSAGYFTSDGKFLVLFKGPLNALTRILLLQYDKQDPDPMFVEFAARIFGNAFGEQSDLQTWIKTEIPRGRPESGITRETKTKDLSVIVNYNENEVPFQVLVEINK